MKDYDPYMHTAEHVLNQTMVRIFGCERAFSSHLEKKKSKVDYNFNRELSELEKEEISKQVNSILKQGLPVIIESMPITEANKKFNLSRLPKSVTEDLRIVKIGNYDACPCIGNHVENTNMVGEFILGNCSFEGNVLRIRFKLKR